jgi:hypothetical protein
MRQVHPQGGEALRHGPISPRAVVTDAEYNATEIRLVEKGDAVLEVVGKAWGWHSEVFDLSTAYE